jgi:hypothetical protein
MMEFPGHDGRRVLTVTASDHTARVWDAAISLLVSELKGHADLGKSRVRDEILGDIERGAFSPDGRFVATASDDKDAMILPPSQRLNGSFPMTWPPAQGKPVPFTAGRIFDAETGRELHGMDGGGPGMVLDAWSSDGRLLLTASNGRQAKQALWADSRVRTEDLPRGFGVGGADAAQIEQGLLQQFFLLLCAVFARDQKVAVLRFQGEKLGEFGAEGVRGGLSRILRPPLFDALAQGQPQFGLAGLDVSQRGPIAGLDGLGFGVGHFQPLLEDGGNALAMLHNQAATSVREESSV